MSQIKADDQLAADDDVVTLREANSALRAQNIKQQRELAALQEQLAALRAELEGRAVGHTANDDPGTTHGERTTGAAAPAPTASPTPSAGFPSQPPAVAPSDGPPATAAAATPPPPASQPPPAPRAPPRHGLSRAQAERYSRHLLLPAFGVVAQERLCRGSVLVVGCGGLGSPVAMYLAAAGVGRLGLVDHDTVDVSNLHRQVLHATSRVGLHKAVSGRLTCAAINPTIQIETHTCGFTPATALPLADLYDVVVDASDNPATRYLVSDACVVAGKPLVSAAAVGTDGQLTVYNWGEDGPCYRCLFPESPSPENCSRCGEAGVLGVVPGIMGCLQALESIKILAGVGDVSSKKMTIFDALAGRFTSVRLRGRNPACVACGSCPTLTRTSLPAYDYVLFTGQPPDDGPPEDLRLIDPRVRLTPEQVARLLAEEAEAAAAAEEAAEASAAAVTAAAAAAPPAAGGASQDGEEGMPDRVSTGITEGGSSTSGLDLERAQSREGVGSNPGGSCDGGGGGGGGAGGEGRQRRRRRTMFLDVRPQAQYDVMALPGVVHVPYERLEQRLPEVLAMLGVGAAAAGAVSAEAVGSPPSSSSSAAAAAAAGETASKAAPPPPLPSAGAAGRDAQVDGGPATGPSGPAAALNGTSTSGGAAAAAAPAAVSGGGVELEAGPGAARPRVVVLCRRGNNSQRVVARLAGLGVERVTDMRGGYAAWAREVDPRMPLL